MFSDLAMPLPGNTLARMCHGPSVSSWSQQTLSQKNVLLAPFVIKGNQLIRNSETKKQMKTRMQFFPSNFMDPENNEICIFNLEIHTYSVNDKTKERVG